MIASLSPGKSKIYRAVVEIRVRSFSKGGFFEKRDSVDSLFHEPVMNYAGQLKKVGLFLFIFSTSIRLPLLRINYTRVVDRTAALALLLE